MQSHIFWTQASERHQQALQQHQAQGLEVAQQAARLLRQRFGAARVVLFGSMRDGTIHENSDIDLAVWGLAASDYFQAVGELQGLSAFAIDLVEVERAPGYLLDAIAGGIEL